MNNSNIILSLCLILIHGAVVWAVASAKRGDGRAGAFFALDATTACMGMNPQIN